MVLMYDVTGATVRISGVMAVGRESSPTGATGAGVGVTLRGPRGRVLGSGRARGNGALGSLYVAYSDIPRLKGLNDVS